MVRFLLVIAVICGTLLGGAILSYYGSVGIEVVFNTPDVTTSSAFAEKLEATVLPRGVVALDWTERLPLVTESMKYVDQTMFIYYLVFFSAMAFGIVNTLLMSIGERTREILVGVLNRV